MNAVQQYQNLKKLAETSLDELCQESYASRELCLSHIKQNYLEGKESFMANHNNGGKYAKICCKGCDFTVVLRGYEKKGILEFRVVKSESNLYHGVKLDCGDGSFYNAECESVAKVSTVGDFIFVSFLEYNTNMSRFIYRKTFSTITSIWL
jgi:hypothetical protein